MTRDPRFEHGGDAAPLAHVGADVAALRRRAAVAVAAGTLGSLAAVVVGLSLWSERMAPGSPLGLLGSVVLLTILALAWRQGRRAVAKLTPRGLAPEAEAAASLGQGDLLGALELEAARPGVSAELAREHRWRVARRLEGLRAGALFPESARRWGLRLRAALTGLGLGGGLLVLAFVVRPGPTRATAAALASPWRAAFPPALPAIAVGPGDTAVLRGAELAIRVSAPGRARLHLVWQVAGEPAQRRELRLSHAGAGGGALGPVEAPTRYWAAADDGAASDTFQVRPLEPLLVEQLRAVLVYPAYLRRASDTLEAPLPAMVLPEGSAVDVSGVANHALAAGELRWRAAAGPGAAAAGGTPGASAGALQRQELTLDGRRFAGRLEPTAGGFYDWHLAAAGAAGEPILPEPIEVVLLADAVPSVELLFPAADTAIGADRVLPLVVRARDDAGLEAVELVTWSGGSERPPVTVRIGPDARGDTRALLRPLLDLRGERLLPGDTAYYFVRARDGNPARPPAVSDTFRAWLPTLDVTRAELARRADELAGAAEAIREASREVERGARQELRRSAAEEAAAAGGGPPDAVRDRDLEARREERATVAASEALNQQLREFEERLARLQAELEGSGLSDPALERQLERLTERWGDLGEDLESVVRELEAALRDQDPEVLREALARLAEEAGSLRERVEAALAQLERAALEQSLKASRATAEQLARRQAAAAEALERQVPSAAREEQLADATESLTRRLEELTERLERADMGQVADSTRAAGELTAQAAERMRQTARSASETEAGAEAERPAAERAAREAAEQLDRAAEALEGASSGAEREREAASQRAVARARAEALALAGEQQRLLERRSQTSRRGEQAAIRQGLDNLERRLAEARRSGALDDAEAERAAAEAKRALQAALEERAETAGAPAGAVAQGRAAIEALNDLALRLLAAEAALQAPAEGAAGDAARERMNALAQRQEGVTGQTRELLVPSGEPMRVAPEAASLAREQARIGEELEEIEAADELLGDPEALAREAREIAERLTAGRVDRETVERQRGLFRRMLDAGRSLEQDQPDTERRESRTGRAAVRFVPETSAEGLAGPRFPFPAADVLGRLPGFYHRLVLDYFDRLNALAPPRPPTRAGGDGGGTREPGVDRG